jgi:NAD(P)-dependent dehydrogenase (short-subunit alcohol dehydrogenase family)
MSRCSIRHSSFPAGLTRELRFERLENWQIATSTGKRQSKLRVDASCNADMCRSSLPEHTSPIAEMVVWLLSERTSYVIGITYNVDGGWMTMWWLASGDLLPCPSVR